MEKWNRKKPKKIYISLTEEQKQKVDKYCKLEDIKKQDLLEDHLADLFKEIDLYLEKAGLMEEFGEKNKNMIK